MCVVLSSYSKMEGRVGLDLLCLDTQRYCELSIFLFSRRLLISFFVFLFNILCTSWRMNGKTPRGLFGRVYRIMLNKVY